ncbi:hypothetical protein LCGC14_3137780, partial [marine sediment metagenome]
MDGTFGNTSIENAEYLRAPDNKALDHIPGERGLPIIGQTIRLQKDIVACQRDNVNRFGQPSRIGMGLQDGVIMEAAMQKRHTGSAQVAPELYAKVHKQFATLGAGNHFVEVCKDGGGQVWLVLHSGSRGVGNVLATAHGKLAKASALSGGVPLEDKDFAWFCTETASFDAYVADMLWAQEYAMASRAAMMNELQGQIALTLDKPVDVVTTINCHHNYAEEVEPGVWLTRKGAINAEVGRMGIIPGSMGAATYIVRGLGCEDALNTAPHGAGRIRSRGAAKRELNLEEFKVQMAGKTWQDRDAEKLLDEAP